MSGVPTVEELRRRVERGVALLDAFDVNWPFHVNVSTLDLCYEQTCVLGQVFEGSDYTLALGTLGLSTVDDAVAHGFDLSEDELLASGFDATDMSKFDYSNYHTLTDTWRSLIHARQVTGVVPVAA